MCIVLQSNRLFVSSELALFNHVLRWVDVDRGERCIDLEEIFQHIRSVCEKIKNRYFKIIGIPLLKIQNFVSDLQ